MSSRKPASRTFSRCLPGALALAASALLPGFARPAQAQTPAIQTAAAVQAAAAVSAQTARITGPLDDQVLYTLKGNVHPGAQARYDQGPAPASMPTGRLTLVLAPSAAPPQALRQ